MSGFKPLARSMFRELDQPQVETTTLRPQIKTSYVSTKHYAKEKKRKKSKEGHAHDTPDIMLNGDLLFSHRS